MCYNGFKYYEKFGQNRNAKSFWLFNSQSHPEVRLLIDLVAAATKKFQALKSWDSFSLEIVLDHPLL